MNMRIAILLIGFWMGLLINIGVQDNKKKVVLVEDTELKKLNDYIDSLNNGGCGFFALKLLQRLDKSRYEIVSINGKEHIVLRDKQTNLYLDSKGYHSKLSFDLRFTNPSYEVISEEFLTKLVYGTKWNPAFKRIDTTFINYYIDKL